MNEPYDRELRRVLKESAGKELHGWEFTPAMRQKVLDQVQQSEAVTPSRSARRANPPALVRPLAWVAVAAAAMLIVVKIGIPGGSMKPAPKESPAKQEMATTAAAPAAAPANGQSARSSTDAAKPAETPAPQAAESKVAADQPAAYAPTAAGAPAAPLMKSATQNVVAYELLLPPATEGAPVMVAPPQSERAFAPGAGFKSLDALAMNRQMGAPLPDGSAVVLTENSVRNQMPDGSVNWERQVDALSEQSVMAVAADGRIAVANGANVVTVLNTRGEALYTMNTTAPVQQMAWSADGRLATAEGLTFVYRDGKPDFFGFEAGNRSFSFAPDGTLAVYGEHAKSGLLLALYDKRGAILLEQKVPDGGNGLALGDDGRIIVAGGVAFDRTGKLLWKLPFRPEGVAKLGTGSLTAWDSHNVFGVRYDNGQPLWSVSWNGAGPGIRKVVASPDGKYVAIVAPTESGAAVWVLDSAGALKYSEQLAEMPNDVAIAGKQLYLLLPNRLLTRQIEP